MTATQELSYMPRSHPTAEALINVTGWAEKCAGDEAEQESWIAWAEEADIVSQDMPEYTVALIEHFRQEVGRIEAERAAERTAKRTAERAAQAERAAEAATRLAQAHAEAASRGLTVVGLFLDT